MQVRASGHAEVFRASRHPKILQECRHPEKSPKVFHLVFPITHRLRKGICKLKYISAHLYQLRTTVLLPQSKHILWSL
ncbi:hypothetical protein JI435_130380 [Parastagonospora nodorum SN15]|uniref:Uncharacterized protein n=1 Tax=Phaeosphaeria nodorum (strain SN15 / ATCC MYA-4574 / FGSC 10173) TaxID=321614 RepID=A0A7U2ID37_PHANO|nr:hypothetical protein JI435_130380 [Parastagonospora nodorum SN15]